MDSDTEASLAFPRDGLYGQFNYAVLLRPRFFVNFLLTSTDMRSQNGISNKHCG